MILESNAIHRTLKKWTVNDLSVLAGCQRREVARSFTCYSHIIDNQKTFVTDVLKETTFHWWRFISNQIYCNDFRSIQFVFYRTIGIILLIRIDRFYEIHRWSPSRGRRSEVRITYISIYNSCICLTWATRYCSNISFCFLCYLEIMRNTGARSDRIS